MGDRDIFEVDGHAISGKSGLVSPSSHYSIVFVSGPSNPAEDGNSVHQPG